MKEDLEKGTIGDVFGTGCSQMKRYQEGNNSRTNSNAQVQSLTPKIVVGKRMGTPRGITSSVAAIQHSCSLNSYV